MNKFIKYNSLFFSVLFLVLAIIEFIGFLNGRGYCGVAALLLIILAALFFTDYKNAKNEKYAKRNV